LKEIERKNTRKGTSYRNYLMVPTGWYYLK